MSRHVGEESDSPRVIKIRNNQLRTENDRFTITERKLTFELLRVLQSVPSVLVSLMASYTGNSIPAYIVVVSSRLAGDPDKQDLAHPKARIVRVPDLSMTVLPPNTTQDFAYKTLVVVHIGDLCLRSSSPLVDMLNIRRMYRRVYSLEAAIEELHKWESERGRRCLSMFKTSDCQQHSLKRSLWYVYKNFESSGDYKLLPGDGLQYLPLPYEDVTIEFIRSRLPAGETLSLTATALQYPELVGYTDESS